jgi:hypothetical protein
VCIGFYIRVDSMVYSRFVLGGVYPLYALKRGSSGRFPGLQRRMRFSSRSSWFIYAHLLQQLFQLINALLLLIQPDAGQDSVAAIRYGRGSLGVDLVIQEHICDFGQSAAHFCRGRKFDLQRYSPRYKKGAQVSPMRQMMPYQTTA